MLGKNIAVYLKWVKAHVGIHGNEVADSIAKKGSSLGEGPTNELLTPQIKQKSEIDDHFHRKWSKAWNSFNLVPKTRCKKVLHSS